MVFYVLYLAVLEDLKGNYVKELHKVLKTRTTRGILIWR